MDDTRKNDLLTQFRVFLENQPVTETDPAQTVDLFSLYSEFIALRSEIKLQTLQFKATFEQWQSATETQQTQLLMELQQCRSTQATQQREIKRILLLEFLEIRDRLETGNHFFEKYQTLTQECVDLIGRYEAPPVTGWKRFFRQGVPPQDNSLNKIQKSLKRLKEGLWKVGEGQAITVRRLDQTLTRHDVRPLEVLHKPFDSQSMRLIEDDHYPNLADGIVTTELRKGFQWENEILRLAEVKVNKRL